jgi:hypothetical protein
MHFLVTLSNMTLIKAMCMHFMPIRNPKNDSDSSRTIAYTTLIECNIQCCGSGSSIFCQIQTRIQIRYLMSIKFGEYHIGKFFCLYFPRPLKRMHNLQEKYLSPKCEQLSLQNSIFVDLCGPPRSG